MSRRSGKLKWVLTFSFIIVTMLKVYRMVLKLRMRGSFLKHALREETIESRALLLHGSKRICSLGWSEAHGPFLSADLLATLRAGVHVVPLQGVLDGHLIQRLLQRGGTKEEGYSFPHNTLILQ